MAGYDRWEGTLHVLFMLLVHDGKCQWARRVQGLESLISYINKPLCKHVRV